jgi:PAS domain S-box-containing protein
MDAHSWTIMSMRGENSSNRADQSYLSFLDNFPALIWRSGINAKCNYFNKTWLEFTGRSMEQETGDGWADGIHPEDSAGCLQGFLKAFHSRQPFALEYRLRRHDGEYRWLLDCGKAFNDLEGQFAGYTGACFDITERKRVEESLSLFRTLVDQSSDGIEVIDPETGRFLDINEITCQRLGYQREELLSMCVPDIETVAVDFFSWHRLVKEIRRSGSKILEGRHKRNDGSTFPVEVNVRYIKLDRDYLIAVVRDISERKQVEEAQRASDARLRRLVDSNVQGVMFANMKGEIINANDAFLHIVGYSRTDLEAGHLNWAALSPPEYMAADQQAVAEMNATGIFSRYEKEYLRKDGTRVPVLVGGASFDDTPTEEVAFVIDLTERKEAELALKNSHAQLRALSARLQSVREEEATHIAREIHDELGQRLAGLKMDLIWTERKLGELTRSAAVNALLDRVVGATEMVDGIIVAVQRIATELRPGVLDKLGLGSALQSEARRFQERTGLICDVCVPAPEPALSPELSTTFFRIFQECLTNVTRHSHASKVNVELKVEGGAITMLVRDNGRGITQAEIANPKSLGLIGMKERAALLGGEITFQLGPDHGTIMTARIPNKIALLKEKELV